ncbi:lysM domain-containing GPI-anchored protein LYP6-like [Zingiber officinale]|uniref:lysM domain-containing GPI-anchored protein LYP6-like n=1 Tax=Zingiber officinale TaxID=94328 RepID=UPI001C4CA47A|nr:lysM domain-containing GPI-anchored protein LYP6-like [Zingiber officinale]
MEKATLALLLFLLSSSTVGAKSTIEPCSGTESCPALLGYKLDADLKVSEVAALFQTDLLPLLAANAIDASLPGVEQSILPAGLFLRVPAACACSGGIRRSVSTRYTVRPADTLASIAASVFSGLASAEQIRDANGIQDPAALDPGRTLLIPLPCTCFNSTDNFLPAVYLSYVVRAADTLPAIAVRYSTTVTDLMNVNAMGSPSVLVGDILAVPLPACPSMFPRYASDYGLIVANGTYTITAGHCVECSCGPGNLNLYCSPASLSTSCSSMQCSNSNLMIGNFTSQQTSAGCNITSCNYAGFVNGSIVTKLTTSLQPQCPGEHQFPPVIPPPTTVVHESLVAPSPSPSPVQTGGGGGAHLTPKTSVPGTLALPGASAASSPAGSASQAVCVIPLSYISAVAFPLVLAYFF